MLIKEKDVVDRLYDKGFMVDICGSSTGDGFNPEYISIRTVQDRKFSIGTWRKIQDTIKLMMDLEFKETTP